MCNRASSLVRVAACVALRGEGWRSVRMSLGACFTWAEKAGVSDRTPLAMGALADRALRAPSGADPDTCGCSGRHVVFAIDGQSFTRSVAEPDRPRTILVP